jgi:ABC-type branched-subunit amino acid transport system ATPase component
MDSTQLNNSAILELNGLSKNFGGVHAVCNASVSFSARMVSSIVGFNGAGKTTVFDIISGLIKADKGQVVYKRHILNDKKPHEIARLGVGRLFQSPRIFGKMTVLDNVAVANENSGVLKPILSAFLWPLVGFQREKSNLSRAKDGLKSVGLLEKADYAAEQISYGQQKLLAVARLLQSGADCFLLDEPTSGLDSATIKTILELIRGIADSGRVVIMIEHNVQAVRQISDYVHIMQNGRIIGSGRPDDILSEKSAVSMNCEFSQYGSQNNEN